MMVRKIKALNVPVLFGIGMWLLFRALLPAGAGDAPSESPVRSVGGETHLAETMLPLSTVISHTATTNSENPLTLVWTSEESVWTFEVAWGDYDGDGDLDLASADENLIRLYRNDGGLLTSSAVWSSYGLGIPLSLAWGDLDNDSDLDLAVGTSGTSLQLFRNDQGVLNPSPVWVSNDTDYNQSIAWGDIEGDGDLDLAVGNSTAPGRIYLNNNGVLNTTASWSAPITETTVSVAWGDMDNDGDLDLALGNEGQPNRVYRNQGLAGGVPQLTLAWSAAITENTTSVAWGDIDNDHDLDLVVGNFALPSHVYFNNGAALNTTPGWSSPAGDWTISIALGDYDNDGDLDLVTGNDGQPNQLYVNTGDTFSTTATWSSAESDSTLSVAWGDVDGDGDLDLAVGNAGHNGQPNRLYGNHGATLSPTAAWSSAESDGSSVAWGDVDNDGDLDLAVGYGVQPCRVYRNYGSAGGTPQLTLAWSSAITDDNTTSIAWGDYDNDGDLDLVVGNYGQPDRLYINSGGTLSTSPAWSSQEPYNTNTVAWGDYDGDGDLDLVTGGSTPFVNEPVRLYRNDDGVLTAAAIWKSDWQDRVTSLAWGDVDNDGDLDLAVGTFNYNRLIRNDRGTLTTTPIWESAEWSQTAGIAWGDYDGDGDLDLAAGSRYQLSRLYRNNGGMLTERAVWASNEIGGATGVAWGDMDGDADLDLAMGIVGPNRLYRNDSSQLTSNSVWSTVESDGTTGLAWGDVDGDGDLDLAVANYGSSSPNRLYLDNRDRLSLPGAVPVVRVAHPGPQAAYYAVAGVQSGIIPISYTLISPRSAPVASVRASYSVNSGGQWLPAVAATGTLTTNLATSITGTSYLYNWDVNASGIFGQSDNVVFRIEAAPAISNAANSIPGPYLYGSYASSTFPFRVRGTQVRVLSGTVPVSNAIIYRLPVGQSGGGELMADAAGNPFHTDGQGYLQGRGQINPGDQLLALAPVASHLNYAGALMFDGVDDYVSVLTPTVPTTNTDYTIAAWIKPDAMGTSGIVGWGNYGAMNQVNALRLTGNGLVNYWWGNDLSVVTGPLTDTWHHVAATYNGLTRTIYLDGVAVGSDTPIGHNVPDSGKFRIGSTYNAEYFDGQIGEVRIYSRALSTAEVQAAMAEVPASATPGLAGYWPFDTPLDHLVPDQSGNGNDGIIVGATWNGRSLGGYTVYHTNGMPTEAGLNAFTVTQPGVQTLVVTATHPLVLFDLDVSLEWDAHNDPSYPPQLAADIQQASEYLYDFSNGQIALGKVTVHQNADDWLASQVVINATNRLRPLAAQGGIVTTLITDPHQLNIVYSPGQVRMGATWNRYGEPVGASDWPLALAHELSHYLLYQEDTYLGLDSNGSLIPIDACTGSAMGDMYDPANTEFVFDQTHWNNACANTLANQTLQRTEWATNHVWYPWLVTPTITNTGPALMPFDLTTVTILDPVTPTTALADPTFFIRYQQATSASSEARAFIMRTEEIGRDYVIDVGSPLGDRHQVVARGAQPGDRLCYFDQPRREYGCEIVRLGEELQLALEHDETWMPVIQVSPVNSQTIGITLDGLTSTLPLRARLYPEYGYGGEVITLTPSSGIYSGTFHLDFPAMAGYVQVWIAEPDPRRETIVAFSIGGNPGSWPMLRGGWPMLRGGWPMLRGGWPMLRGGWPMLRGGWPSSRGSAAPLASPGGQMLFFTHNPASIPEDNLYTIQSMAGLPPLPADKKAIGQGYSLVASPNVTQVITGSISFQYLGIDVLVEQANERQLTIHFWNGNSWEALETMQSPDYNMASTPSRGPGVYALLAGVTRPQLEALDPSTAINEITTTLTIRGHDFLPPVDVKLISLTTTYTLPVLSASPFSITTIVTQGLPAHEYQVMVVNRYDDAPAPTSLPFALYDPAPACFYDFFSSGSSQWQRSGAWDIVTLSNGEQAMTDSPMGNYDNAIPPAITATTSITTTEFRLDKCAHPVLTFRHDYVIAKVGSSQDVGRVEISTDQGATWATLASYRGGGPYASAVKAGSDEWSDVQWKPTEINLSAYTGTLRLRFSLEVDGYISDRGWVLDNVMVIAKPSWPPIYLPIILRSGP
jgi:hypothetical protein